MRILMTGCEYTGVTTLTRAIIQWGEETIGGQMGDGHDHFKVPHLAHESLTTEEQSQILALSPRLTEIFQRYNIEYHLQPSFFQDRHHILVGMHIDEAVYAPLYYGYGGPGEYAERTAFARHTEERLVESAPDYVHVLVKASPDVVAKRMKEGPHENAVLQEKDIDLVLRRFEEELEHSNLRNKITIDTSTATVQESLAELVQKVEPYLNDSDRTAILVKRAQKRGEWL